MWSAQACLRLPAGSLLPGQGMQDAPAVGYKLHRDEPIALAPPKQAWAKKGGSKLPHST